MPQPMGREQEADAEEKNRHGRVQGASRPARPPPFLQMEKLKAAELHWAQYLLASWRKAKEIWILNFYFFASFPSPVPIPQGCVASLEQS